MPRKKIIRKAVDKKDGFIEPKEALEMRGISRRTCRGST